MESNRMFNPDNFDLSVKPSDDFNLFVNGQWLKNNPIPSKYTRWGTFEELHEKNLQRVKELIENSDGYFSKLKTYYQSAINEEKLNLEGSKPVKLYMDSIDQCLSKEELWELLANLYIKGLAGIFGFFSEEDAKNSELVVPYLSSGGLGLPDRDYYFDEDKEEIREKYKVYLNSLYELYYGSINSSKINAVYEIQEKFAKKIFTRVEKRDPEKNYNKMMIHELKSKYNLDWDTFFGIITNNIEIPYVIVDNPEYFTEFSSLWNSVDLDVWKDYIKLKVLSSTSSYLSDNYVNLKFSFYNKTLSGQKEIKPRWERAIAMINSDLGELVGRTYTDKYFKKEAKVKMLDMVNELNKELKKRLINLSWMSEETKKKALLKNDAFTAKIGYPEKWRSYDSLKLDSSFSLVNNSIKCSEFNHFYEIDRLFKPSDPNRWEMDPHTINAYFHPLKNEIVFPAGILQSPFFDVDADDAFNYGAIGTVIGHEMTHSYDDMGRQFDHNGNLNNWWTDEDLSKFKEKAQYYIDEFSSFKSNDKNLNGELTLGENLADHGGVKIGFYALMNKLGKTQDTCGFEKYTKLDLPSNYISLESLTDEQKFFIAWAQVWKNNITKEELDKRIMTDPHSPGEWRVNGTLANIPEFHKVFEIQPGSKMYRENPVQMW